MIHVDNKAFTVWIPQTSRYTNYWCHHGPLDKYVKLRMPWECRERFPRHRFQRKPLVSDPGIHHGTWVTHVPWCMSRSLTRGGGENVPGACATGDFAYLARGPLVKVMACLFSAKPRTTNVPFLTAKPDTNSSHDDVIKWKHFPRYWPFVRGIHRSPVNSPHKGQWRGALMFSLTCTRINGWVNNGQAGDLRRHRAHYDVIVMLIVGWRWCWTFIKSFC